MFLKDEKKSTNRHQDLHWPPKSKEKELSIITGSKKLKNSVITVRRHCCQEEQLQWI